MFWASVFIISCVCACACARILSKFYFGKFQSYLGHNKEAKQLIVHMQGRKEGLTKPHVDDSVRPRYRTQKDRWSWGNCNRGPSRTRTLRNDNLPFPTWNITLCLSSLLPLPEKLPNESSVAFKHDLLPWRNFIRNRRLNKGPWGRPLASICALK